jgi:hypothetical protein
MKNILLLFALLFSLSVAYDLEKCSKALIKYKLFQECTNERNYYPGMTCIENAITIVAELADFIDKEDLIEMEAWCALYCKKKMTGEDIEEVKDVILYEIGQDCH